VFAAGKLVPKNQDYWMGIYSGKSKIGYMHVTTSPDKYNGKDVYRRDETVTLVSDAGSPDSTATISNTLYSDATLFPIKASVAFSSPDGNGSVASQALFEVNYTQKTVETKCPTGMTFALKDGTKASSLSQPYVKNEKADLRNGTRYLYGMWKFTPDIKDMRVRYVRQYILVGPKSSDDPNNMSFNYGEATADFQVIRHEKLKLDGKTYDALLVLESAGSDHRITWMTTNGDVLKTQFCGTSATLVREPKDKAQDINSKCPD
jgi:hypothetical protein